MRYAIALVMISGLLMVSLAAAQIDPDPDGMGIYFDSGGLINCLTGLEPDIYGPGFVYPLVARPSFPEDLGITGWEARLA